MDVVKKANIKFPFLYEIVQLNHDYLLELKVDEDFDSYIVLMNLYLYTCKHMKRNNMELNKDNIYKNMEITLVPLYFGTPKISCDISCIHKMSELLRSNYIEK
jgi:hypothetical protein